MSERAAAVRWVPTVLFAGLVAFVAGRAAAIPEVPGGAPFAFAAPSTFARIDASSGTNPNGTKLWVEPSAVSPLEARVTETHSSHLAALEEPALAEIAAGMPAVYATSKGAWTESRHLVHVRPDGKKVGLIAGDLTTETNVRMSTMQMMFPDDTGSSIVTASFAVPSAQRLVPVLEKAMDDSTGVKAFGKPAPNWVYYAWGIGALVVAIGAQLLFARRGR